MYWDNVHRSSGIAPVCYGVCKLFCSWFGLAWLCGAPASLLASDMLLTIGGGYAPQGNQASLEANVQFYQRIIAARNIQAATHAIYFADGFDPQADLQIVIKNQLQLLPAQALLQEIFAPPSPPGVVPGSQQLGYRNHRVSNIVGANRLTEIRAGLEKLKASVRSGDRLLVYVTAHGGAAARSGSPYDTSISCWGKDELKMSELAQWLDSLPSDVQVLMVMAQCYCGGFAHTVFKAGDPQQGISHNLRSGFFAQRHDLPAAGCRPDVDNDEEYSSYFWGALLGQTRTGRPAKARDIDQDGQVSLAEAHAFAIIESDTIDIPTRGSDALLRQCSRIANYELDLPVEHDIPTEDESLLTNLLSLEGPLDSWQRRASAVDAAIIQGLCARLEIKPTEEVAVVFQRYEQSRRDYRSARRGSGRRGARGGYSRRRELQTELIEKWPELENETERMKLPLLVGEAGDEFVRSVQALPSYQQYVAIRDGRTSTLKATLTVEMQQVLLRRLIQTLESVVLAANLEYVATPEQQQRYRDLLELENMVFGTLQLVR